MPTVQSPLVREVVRRGDAIEQMASDERLLELVGEGSISVPTMRIYGWNKPSITYGYHQDPRVAFDLDFCEAHGVPVVRRPTGGRGILHFNDLTISVCLPVAGKLDGIGVAESARLLASPIEDVLRAIGHTSDQVGHSTRGIGLRYGAPDCFSLALPGDILVGGRKAVGSAQVRRRGILLQQMNIPVAPAADSIFGKCFRPEASLPRGLLVDWEYLCREVEQAYQKFFELH